VAPESALRVFKIWGENEREELSVRWSGTTVSDVPSRRGQQIVVLPRARRIRVRKGASTASSAFTRLAEQWEDETWPFSFVERKIMHPAYQRIMAMGQAALPFILGRLRDHGPDHWFWALQMITGENPANGQDTMDGATEAWLAWGRERGYL
jgi:hypothetical protein